MSKLELDRAKMLEFTLLEQDLLKNNDVSFPILRSGVTIKNIRFEGKYQLSNIVQMTTK